MLRASIARALDRMRLAVPAFRVYEAILSLDRQRFARVERTPDEPPLPPASLRVLVGGKADPVWFIEDGKRVASLIRSTLATRGVRIDELGTILDFGCACGRVARHWQGLAGPRIYGTDYNPKLVEWCQANLPFGDFSANGLAPPLRYADESFDLVYAVSVFTHMPEDLGLAWVAELRRVLRPGGYLLFTTAATGYVEELAPAERAEFAAGDLVVRHSRAAGTNLCTAYHPRSYIERRLTPIGFLIESYTPAEQTLAHDLFLLSRAPAPD